MKRTVIDCYGIICCDVFSSVSLEFWQQDNGYLDGNSFVHCLFVGVFVAMKMLYGSLQEIRKGACVCHKMRISEAKILPGRVIVNVSLHQHYQIVSIHTHCINGLLVFIFAKMLYPSTSFTAMTECLISHNIAICCVLLSFRSRQINYLTNYWWSLVETFILWIC